MKKLTKNEIEQIVIDFIEAGESSFNHFDMSDATSQKIWLKIAEMAKARAEYHAENN